MAVLDDTKNAADLTTQAQGTITLNEPGPAPGMVSTKFVGTGARADAGNVYQFSGVAAFSFECWFMLDALTTGTPRLVTTEYTSGTDSGWAVLMTGTTGQVNFVRTISGVSNFADFGVLDVDRWYHLVATYDGTSMKAYRNGVLITTTASAGSIPSGTTTLRVGAHSAGLASINGWLSSVAIYSAALTLDEIRARWRAGRRGVAA